MIAIPRADHRDYRPCDYQLWLANVGVLAVVTSCYLAYAPFAHPEAYLYLGMVSCAATVSLIPGLLVALAGQLRLSARWRGPLAALLWTLAVLLLFLDLQIYGMFRYHLNGMVWNVLTTPGSGEAVHVLPKDLWIIGTGTALLFAAELYFYQHLRRRLDLRAVRADMRRPLLRPGRVWLTVLVPVMFLQVVLLARAEFVHDRAVMSLSRLFPLLTRVSTAWLDVGFLRSVLGEAPFEPFIQDNVLLNYPTKPIALPVDGPTPNIVFLVADSLRADALTPELMPKTSAFASRAQVFRNHLSGGNATRFGVFSLVYGLPGCYWRSFLHEQRSPVLIDALLQRGYATTILTSASMDFPEFRRTAWVRVEDTVEDRLRGTREGGRDDGVETRFVSWLAERADDAPPFLAFLLLDATHQTYAFPEEFARFRPYAKQLSYLELARGPSAEEVTALRNRYQNAVLYADHVIGDVLAALEASGELERSIVIITGDHGEEFMENGFYGHASNFTRTQLQVPLVWFDAAVGAGEVTAPTSHSDVPVTLLERLGLDPQLREAWSLGRNLFDGETARIRVASGWDMLGVRLPDETVLEVPLEPYGRNNIEVYEPNWQPAADADEILAGSGPLLSRVAFDCRRFLR